MSALAQAPTSLPQLVTEFLSSAIHLILFSRRLYPEETFERRRLFDVQVYRSRHPELAEYISFAVRGVQEMLQRGEADALVLLIHAPAIVGSGAAAPGRVVEKFVFELAAAAGDAPPDVDLAPLRAQLRGFLLKLHVCDSLLSPLPCEPHELSFTLEIHSQACCAPPSRLPREALTLRVALCTARR